MLKYFFLFYFIFNYCYSNDEYFLTLRNDNVNLRLGPSFEYPVKIIYKKKYLPVLIKEKFVKDFVSVWTKIMNADRPNLKKLN